MFFYVKRVQSIKNNDVIASLKKFLTLKTAHRFSIYIQYFLLKDVHLQPSKIMIAQLIIIFLFIISLAAIFILYAYKLALHFMYLRVQDKKKPGSVSDFFYRDFKDKKDGARWKEAWMLFPLLFPIALDDEKQELNEIKARIKRLNVAIYSALIVALIVIFYAAQFFPEGIL